MADKDKAFRQQLLAGTKATGRDTPLVRATAAAEHLAEQAAAARTAEAGAEKALAKARDQLDAAQRSLDLAREAREAAERDAGRADRLLADVRGGGHVQVDAGVAGASGEASH